MSDKLDWRTEEEDTWEVGGRSFGPAKRRRRWLMPLVIIVTFTVAAGLVSWQARERMTSAQDATANDILSSFNLIRQANAVQDAELFRNLLSGSDLEWAMAQQQLFKGGFLFDLNPYGLAPLTIEPPKVSVKLSPKLDSGEVTALAAYSLTQPGLPSETVRLRQVSVFRRGERWVWSPPKDDFWQGSETADGQYLMLTYPKRDEEVALRLQRDLDAIIIQQCQAVRELTCPPNLTIDLTLSHEPAAILAVNEQFAVQGYYGTRLGRGAGGSSRLGLTMPTPSLLGLPVDEAGYQALLRGYGKHLAVALAVRMVDTECCGSDARFRAAVQVMLSDLGLLAWPEKVSGLPRGANVSPGDARLALLCSEGYRRLQRMYVLDVSKGKWRAEPDDLRLFAAKAMPNGDGVLLLGQKADSSGVSNQIWHRTARGDQLLFELRTTADEAEHVGWEMLEQQRRLLVNFPNLIRGFNRYFTIDLEACIQGRCQPVGQSMIGRPVWSPDGRQYLVSEYGLLWKRQDAATVPVADGAAPFWLDEVRFGFVRSVALQQAIVVTTVDGSQGEEVVLTTDDLRKAIDDDDQPSRLLIGRVLISPDEAGRWLILTFDVGAVEDVGQARFLSYDPVSGGLIPITHEGRLLSFNMSPSGSWLALGGFDDSEGRWKMTVLDAKLKEQFILDLAEGGSSGAVPSYSWSADEQWLLVLEQGLVTLLHPASGQKHEIVPPEPGCVQAAWFGER